MRIRYSARLRLIITNGDCTTQGMQEGGVEGVLLPWRDVLHDGPVPAGPDLDELAEIRAGYISGQGWATYEEVLADFRQRNALVRQWADFEEIVLWFEHDLYDQLQILEILAHFADVALGATRLGMLCIDRHPEVPGFRGLGQLSPEQMKALEGKATPVTEAQLALAARAWAAFRAPDPSELGTLAHAPHLPLPFLAAALRSALELYPDTRRGLPRLETEMLALAAPDGAGAQHPRTVEQMFRAHQDLEDMFFVGDGSFLWRALELCGGPAPLLRFADGAPPPAGPLEPLGRSAWNRELALTDLGREVLHGDGRVDVAGQRGYDRWIGGVHLVGEPRWRWDAQAGSLRATS
jgi:hypothetical protein